MKACTGRRGISPLILDLGARWRWLVSMKLRPFISGKKPWCPVNRKKVMWAPETVWIFWRKETPLSLPGFEVRTVQFAA